MAKKLVTVLRQQALGALALFVALGGTSYAVATGSIDSREIKNSTIRGKDVKNNSLKGADVTALGTGDIRDSSLLAKDFKPGQLPAGPAGPRGATGAPGMARAYGAVSENGGLTRSRGATVTKPGEGIYCITAPGVSSSDTPVVVSNIARKTVPGSAVVTGQTGPGALSGIGSQQASVEWFPDGPACPSGAWQVRTAVQIVSSNEERLAVELQDSPFAFVIP